MQHEVFSDHSHLATFSDILQCSRQLSLLYRSVCRRQRERFVSKVSSVNIKPKIITKPMFMSLYLSNKPLVSIRKPIGNAGQYCLTLISYINGSHWLTLARTEALEHYLLLLAVSKIFHCNYILVTSFEGRWTTMSYAWEVKKLCICRYILGQYGCAILYKLIAQVTYI